MKQRGYEMEKDTVLIVDDMEINRMILSDILEDDYRVLSVCNGLQALDTIAVEQDNIVAILLDLVMPGIDGYEVLRSLRSQALLSTIPVLIISSEDSSMTEQECFNMGISDYIHKPFDRGLVRTRVNNIVSLYQYKRQLEKTVEEQTGIIKKRNGRMLDLLASVVESRDLESGTHVQRVKDYTKVLAEQLRRVFPKYGLTEHKIEVIVAASALHDVGKISIPDSILLKPGKLTEDEFEVMKLHTIKGSDFLKNAQDLWDDDYGKVGYEIARYHHEKYDGHGYPEGLSGAEIPISAQIVSIADAYDALVHERCYKEAFSKEEAYEMIVNGECGIFNPDILECFKERREDFERLAE